MQQKGFALRVLAVVGLACVCAAPTSAQDFRLAGGLTLPRLGGRGAQVGGQVQASAEVAPATSGFGVRVDVLYAQSPAQSLSLADAVFAGQTMRTTAAVGGVFYRREMRDVAPYVLGGVGAYGQTGTSGASLGVHGGVGVDYNGGRSRPFFEVRAHRVRGDQGSAALQPRERSMISALLGFRL